MRLIRTGLEALGLDANSFLRHNSRRIIYGVPLCANTGDVVLRMSTRHTCCHPGTRGLRCWSSIGATAGSPAESRDPMYWSVCEARSSRPSGSAAKPSG